MLALEAYTAELLDELKRADDEKVVLRLNTAYRRIYRLRMYMAALLGVGLTASGIADFSVKQAKRLLAQDKKKCQFIVLDSDIETVNNKIEFLLDGAEQKIRDAALCGWKFRGGALEKVLI